MHEHNEELIMALAEDRLPPAEAAAATAEIEACAQCGADLELLRVALDATAQAPRVYMSAAESARLHEGLHRELRLASPAPVAARPRPVWGRVAGWAVGVAAIFLGAVVLVPALTGGGDDDAASDVVAAEETEGQTATTVAAFQVSPGATAEELDDVSIAGGVDIAADESADEPAADAPLASETTASPASFDLPIIGDEGLTEELRDEILAALALDADAYRAADAAAKAGHPDYVDCIEQTMEDGYSTRFSAPDNSEPQLIGLVGDGRGDENLLVAYVTPNLDETAVASISPIACEFVAALP